MNDTMKKLLISVLMGVASVAAVAAVLFLVPSSPALMVDVPVYVGAVNEWGEPEGVAVTAYAICVAAGVAGAILWMTLCGKKQGGWTKGAELALLSGVCALFCSRLLFCVLRWSYIINDLGGIGADEGFVSHLGYWLSFLVQPWQGGFTMFGAIFGALLGALVWSRLRKHSLAETMDLLIPGLLLVIALGRFGEQFTAQGMASDRAAEGLSLLPFAGQDEWGSPMLRVYAYEAIAALAALAASLVMLLRKVPAGRAAETGLVIVSVMQIMLDSWRNDEQIKFGFVCLNMVMAAVVVVFVLATRIIRSVKASGWKVWTIARIPLFLAAVGAVIIIEFGLDGKMGITAANSLLYGMQAAAIIAMGASVLIGDGRKAA